MISNCNAVVAHQAAIGRAVEGKDGAGLETVRAHKVTRVLHHVHALGIAAIHPEPAPRMEPGHQAHKIRAGTV